MSLAKPAMAVVPPGRRWRGPLAVVLGLIAALITAFVVGELVALTLHLRGTTLGALREMPGSSDLHGGRLKGDPQREWVALLLFLYIGWWVGCTIWVGVIVARGRELRRLVLPGIVEMLFLVSLLLLLP